MENGRPYRSGLKPERIKIFEDESLDELEKKVDQWLSERGDSIVVVCASYSVAFIPAQAGYFQPYFKYNKSVVIRYCEKKW